MVKTIIIIVIIILLIIKIIEALYNFFFARDMDQL